MKTNDFKYLQNYYLEVELHLFKTKLSFKEWLASIDEDFVKEILNDEEEVKKHNINISLEDIKELINILDIKVEENYTNKNILVKHIVSNKLNIEILVYNLKSNQSYTTHEKVANKYIMNNNTILKNGCCKFTLGGLVEVIENARVYLYTNK